MGFLKLGGGRERRGSPENPSTSLSSPASWLYEAFGAEETWSGAKVNQASALKMPTVWACVDIISKTIGSYARILYRRNAGGGRERAEDLDIFWRIGRQPNPEMSRSTLERVRMGHILTWGNGYRELVRNRLGEVVEEWPLLPDRTKPHRVSEKDAAALGLPGPGKYLRVRLEPGAAKPSGLVVAEGDVWLPPGKYSHAYGLSYDGLIGYSPVAYHRQTIGAGQAAAEFGARFYGSGMKSSFILKSERTLSPQATENLRQVAETMHGGLSQSHRMAILDAGLSVEKIGFPPEDAQYLETRVHTNREIAQIYDMPLHRLADMDKGASHNSVAAKTLDFYQQTIAPWVDILEQVDTAALTEGLPGGRYFIEYLQDTRLIADPESRSVIYERLVRNGIMTRNEVRRRENLNPVEDAAADMLFVELNMAPINSAAQVLPMGGDEGRSLEARGVSAQRAVQARWRIMEAQKLILSRAANAFVAREVRALLRALTAASNSAGAFREQFMARARELWADLPQFIRQAFMPAIQQYLELLLLEIEREAGPVPGGSRPQIDREVEAYVEALGKRYTSSSEGQILSDFDKAGGDDAAAEAAVRARLEQWKETRAGRVGSREAVQANGFISRVALVAAGVTTLRWLTIGDSCPLCLRMNGRVVGVEQSFLEAGDTVDPEDGETAPLVTRGRIKHPPLHGGCDCLIVSG